MERRLWGDLRAALALQYLMGGCKKEGGGCPIPGDSQGQAGWALSMELWVSVFIAGGLDQVAFLDPYHSKDPVILRS